MAAALPDMANPNVPWIYNPHIIEQTPAGRINVGDFTVFSAGHVVAYAVTNAGSLATALASGAGFAQDAHPSADWYGIEHSADKITILRAGRMWVDTVTGTAHVNQIGTRATPISTGSGLYAATGQDGSAAQWSAVPAGAVGQSALNSGLGMVVDARGGSSKPQWQVLFDLSSLNAGYVRAR